MMTLFLRALENTHVTADLTKISYINMREFKFLLQLNKYNISLTERYIKFIDWEKFWDTQREIPEEFIRHFAHYVRDWSTIIRHQTLSEQFMRDYADDLNWVLLSQTQEMSCEFIEEFNRRLDWCNIACYQKLSKQLIEKYHNKIITRYILSTGNVQYSEDFLLDIIDLLPDSNPEHDICFPSEYNYSVSFLRKFSAKLNWIAVSKQKLTQEFISEFKHKVNWGIIIKCQYLSPKFINDHIEYLIDHLDLLMSYQLLDRDFIFKYNHKINWQKLSLYQILSEEIVREFADKVCWSFISQKKWITENFIREFSDKITWHQISRYAKLSEAFIEEHAMLVDWDNICINQDLSDEFIIRNIEHINLNRFPGKLSDRIIDLYGDTINVNTLTLWCKLSDANLRKYKSKFDGYDMKVICHAQRLTENFMSEFADKLDWAKIAQYQSLSNDFIKQNAKKLDAYYTTRNKKLSHDTRHWCKFILPCSNLPFTGNPLQTFNL